MTLKDYQKQIQAATTKEELRQISYKALTGDGKVLRRSNSLWNKVIDLCIKREEELGFLTIQD